MTASSYYLKDNPSGFPYNFFQTHIKNGYPDVIYHWHPELEIIFVEKGTARFHVNYEIFNSQPGDLIFIQPTSMHSIHPIDQEEHLSQTFKIHLDNLGRSTIEQFSQRYLQPLHNGHFELMPRIQPHMAGYEDIKTLVQVIFKLCHDQPLYYDILLKAKLHELLYLLYSKRYVVRHYTDDIYRKYEKLKDLIAYLNTHYMEDLSIDFLADYFGYSRAHFMTIFKQHTGSSCLDFILQLRLSKTCEALVHTDQSVTQITEAIGFNNQANFNRQFKQRYQMTPLQYRKRFTDKD
ncbi:AraC family transcriptional regulator [Streptococcus saliviloxodontae]|uniref:AraC-like DNA-binding protein n=1 Tax=Streptococcus saliviloxodontae TaxID=1349416 RepID=A0ABS2PM69_9STRE|nr:AraC family transcriptional regulator [Streptococcus saliviloxodontae]MBM7636449.1 AraC-like DNA-binding protein [Streptococcus saliviloxodontae]